MIPSYGPRFLWAGKRASAGFVAAAWMGLTWLALGAPSILSAGTCVPVSASITVQADDQLKMWINGTQVGPNPFTGQGHTYTTYSIDPAVFDPSGTNFFAVENINNTAPAIGADWVISMQCADGSQSYITNADNSFWLYDDGSGGAPPPNDGSGKPWYQNAWTNPSPGTYFNETPVAVTGSWWYTPMDNPVTGLPLPVMSSNPAGNDISSNEVLYYRESVTLVEQPTPVPTPTYVPGCGPPAYVGGSMLLAGPNGNNLPAFNATYNLASAISGALVLVDLEDNGSPAVSSMTFGGAPMALWNSVAGPGGSTQSIYYLTAVGLSAGPQNLAVNYATNTANQQTIVELHIFSGVDLAAPFGANLRSTATAASFTDGITTTGQVSLLLDLLGNTQNNFPTTLGSGQVNTGVTGSTSGLAAWSDYKVAGAPGYHAMTYQWNPSGQTQVSWLVEVDAPGCAGTPTDTPTPSPVITATPTLAVTPTSSRTATPTRTASASPTASPTATRTYTPVPPGSTRTDTPTVTETRTPAPVNTPVPGAPGFRIITVYPNPVAGTGCYFVLNVPRAETVSFKVYDLRGELVWSASQAFNGSGTFQQKWLATNNAGAAVSYGAYYLVAGSGEDSDSKWLTVVR